MSALLRIAQEMRDAERPRGDRAYDHLREAVEAGTAITLSDHDLVLAISRALWAKELATVALGLSELEIRTAMNTVHELEEKAA